MGKVANRYSARANGARRVHRQKQQQARDAMLQAARNGLNEQLYARTPLPVSHAMHRALAARITGDSIIVGFITRRARHTRRRLSMKGTSKGGGHALDMDLPAYMRRAYPVLRSIFKGCRW